MSTPASLSGAAYSRTASVVCAEKGSSLSISGTSLGQATGISSAPASRSWTSSRVAPRLDRRLRREQADPAVARRLHGRVRLGRDHADDGHLQLLLQLRERGRGGRVARDEDELHVLRLEEHADLVREAADLLERPRAVRQARVVAEVREVLVGHGDEALVQDGQPAHARVEDADGPRIHSRDSRSTLPTWVGGLS